MIDEDLIRRVQKAKYLGLEADENLIWNKQYKGLKYKIKCGLSSIRKLGIILIQTNLEQVYRALVEYHQRYEKELWGSLSDTKLDHLQHGKDRACTIIENAQSKGGVCVIGYQSLALLK